MFWRRKSKKIEEFYGELLGEDISIIEHLADGLLVFDRINKLIIINPQAEEFLVIRKEKVLGISFLSLSRFPNFKPLISLLGPEIKEVSREEAQIKKDFILEVTAIPIIAEGEKFGTIVVLHDVSREKLVEKMKNEFVALAAHRLRTPTSAVKWSLGMLLKGDFGRLSAEQREVIRKTYVTNERMIRLIEDLLNLATLEEGKYLSKIALFDIEKIIQSIISENQERIKRKNLKVEIKKSNNVLPQIMLDERKIEIAIENILDNAIRYTLPGGEINIFIKASKKEIEIQIKDNGVGIPDDQQEKVFSKFFRGANAIKMETEGTGLGLFIAKNIIEAHGGDIWFNSKEGKGTTFYFTLPTKKGYGEFLTEEFY